MPSADGRTKTSVGARITIDGPSGEESVVNGFVLDIDRPWMTVLRGGDREIVLIHVDQVKDRRPCSNEDPPDGSDVDSTMDWASTSDREGAPPGSSTLFEMDPPLCDLALTPSLRSAAMQSIAEQEGA